MFWQGLPWKCVSMVNVFIFYERVHLASTRFDKKKTVMFFLFQHVRGVISILYIERVHLSHWPPYKVYV